MTARRPYRLTAAGAACREVVTARRPGPTHSGRRRVQGGLVTVRRLGRALAVAVAASLFVPGAACAHAMLERTEPARGAQLARAPERVTLRFDEPVEVQLGAVRVVDAAGHEVQEGPATHPGGRLYTIAVRVRRALPAGGYTVTYRVVSPTRTRSPAASCSRSAAAGAPPRASTPPSRARRPGP